MDIRQDDGAGLRIAMSAAAGLNGSTFANPSTGLGTLRDPTTHNVVLPQGRLSDRELSWLYQDGIVAKIVDSFPVECADSWMNFVFARQTNYRGYGVTGDALEDYLDNKVSPDELDQELSLTSVRSLFREQSINARIFRNAYILIGVDDGREYSEPIDAQNIRSIDYLEPLYHFDIYPDGQGTYRLSRSRSDNRSTVVDVPFSGIIHPSRLIKFYGKAKPAPLRQLGLDEDYSAIDGIFKALSRASQSLDALNYYIQTASVFDYGLDGFSDVRDPEDELAMAKRMQTIMMGLSALKVFMRDSERESMGTISRNFGGVGDALDRITDSICYYTDVPRHIIFGTSNQRGIGNQGKEGIEERMWDEAKIAWRARHWQYPYLYLGKLACLAKDSPTGGRLPKGLGIEIPSALKRSESDKVDNLGKFADAVAVLIDKKVLSPIEVRQAFAGDDINFTITLDVRVSEQMEDELDDADAEEIGEDVPEGDEAEDDDGVDDPDDVETEQRSDGGWLVWFGGRRTPVAVSASSRSEAIKKARQRKKRGGDKVASARQANASERKTAANGGWIRTGPNGEKPGKSKLRGFGPKPKGR